MVYVKHFDILGVDTAQIPCIELQGAPNAATVGAVGLLGMDMTSEGHEIYVCTAVNGAIYTWQCLKDGKDGTCVVKSEINDSGELVLTLSDGKTLNVGIVKGKDGEKGDPGKDGVSITETELNDNCELIITLSNGTVKNLGSVRGEKGDSVFYMHRLYLSVTSPTTDISRIYVQFPLITSARYSTALDINGLANYFATGYSDLEMPAAGEVKLTEGGTKVPIHSIYYNSYTTPGVFRFYYVKPGGEKGSCNVAIANVGCYDAVTVVP